MATPDQLRRAREAVGLNQADVARRLGIKASAVSQWEAVDGTSPARKWYGVLAEMYRVPRDFFLTDRPAQEVAPAPPVDIPAVGNMIRDVPIYGVAAAGDEKDGAFNFDSEVVDYGRRPPSLSSARDVYGLFIASESMEPVYRRGDLIYARKKLPARPGDDVILHIATGGEGEQPSCFIKRLVRQTADRVIVEQFNPPKKIEFPVAKVIAIDRVLSLGEVLGS